MKFSIIIPVYNVEDYLKRCLDSVIQQSFSDFEVIIINDGSTDKSRNICEEYERKDRRIKLYNQDNMGLSAARNNGIKKASGDYLLFLDSDDYYEKDLLIKLNKYTNSKYDVIRFQVQYDKNDEKVLTKGASKDIAFDNGIEAFSEIATYEIVEGAWCYAYNRDYFFKNNFLFKEGCVHEDFGLIPLIIIKAKKVICINYVGYNYVIRENSIMTSNDYEKVLKKANDFLIHFKYLISNIDLKDKKYNVFKSFIANSIILKATTLKGNDYKKYLKELRKLKVFKMLLADNTGRKIKKILIRISPKMYYKVMR